MKTKGACLFSRRDKNRIRREAYEHYVLFTGVTAYNRFEKTLNVHMSWIWSDDASFYLNTAERCKELMFAKKCTLYYL